MARNHPHVDPTTLNGSGARAKALIEQKKRIDGEIRDLRQSPAASAHGAVISQLKREKLRITDELAALSANR